MKKKEKTTRKKKDGKIFNCYLSSEIYDLLDEHSIRTGLTKTMITERAIKQYLGNCGNMER